MPILRVIISQKCPRLNKASMKLLRLVCLFACVVLSVRADQKSLDAALVFGADAALNVYVHDEMNKPITGACVRCGFWLQTSKSSKAVYGQTDATGHFLANLNDPNLESDIVKKNADRSGELQQW